MQHLFFVIIFRKKKRGSKIIVVVTSYNAIITNAHIHLTFEYHTSFTYDMQFCPFIFYLHNVFVNNNKTLWITKLWIINHTVSPLNKWLKRTKLYIFTFKFLIHIHHLSWCNRFAKHVWTNGTLRDIITVIRFYIVRILKRCLTSVTCTYIYKLHKTGLSFCKIRLTSVHEYKKVCVLLLTFFLLKWR